MIAFAVATLFLLLALGLPVAVAMGLLAIALIEMFSTLPLTRAIGEITWTASTGFLVVSVPLFVLMGEIMLRSGVANRMYGAVSAWLSWLPGGLMHANIGSSAMFAAMSGSSVATAATIGTTAMPQIREHRYNEPLFLGSLAAGGTLGILIPPSINLIVYGLITNTSIPQLYLAGIVPGLVLTALFMTVTIVACLLRPAWGGIPVDATWHARFGALNDLVPPLLMLLLVLGSIYLGWATATESAALGVAGAMAIAAARGTLTLSMLRAALEGTMRTTAMIMFIVMAAFFLNFALVSVGFTQAVVRAVSDLQLSPLGILLGVIVFYLVLGCFMETMSMMIATIPLVAPIVFAAGFDPVWFGILVIVLMEAAMITPPVGINLFVIQGLRKRGRIGDVAVGVVPFHLAILGLLALLVVEPRIALWLPQTLR